MKIDEKYVQHIKDGRIGNYFAPVGTPANHLGINPAGRVPITFAPVKETEVLKSKAKEIVDTWTDPNKPYPAKGGGTQYFVPNKENLKQVKWLMNKRLELFYIALEKCENLIGLYPDLIVLKSIYNQIEYLISFEKNMDIDKSRISEIIIGVQTVREIEPLDDIASEIFYRVADEARKMNKSMWIEKRALPFSSLNKPYRQYEVIKPITPTAESKILPWFGQPGQGTQYKLPKSVQELLDPNNPYLKEIRNDKR